MIGKSLILVYEKANQMQIKISHVIEYKLRFLKLTRAGKIRLTVFSDKTLYKALSLLQRTLTSTPDNPFNTYFALCLLEGQRLQLEPDWNAMNSFPNFDETGPVTLEDEHFDAKICHEVLANWKNRKTSNVSHGGTFQKTNQSYGDNNSKHGPTFNRGIMYFKYGVWYKYPDQAWTKDSRPALPTSHKQATWLIERGICPKKTLRDSLPDLVEDQIAIFHLYESPLMKEFLREQNGNVPPTPTAGTGSINLNVRIGQHDPRRDGIDPIEELKTAIKSGKMNKAGLKILRESFIDAKTARPDIIELIDSYISDDADPEDLQKPLF